MSAINAVFPIRDPQISGVRRVRFLGLIHHFSRKWLRLHTSAWLQRSASRPVHAVRPTVTIRPIEASMDAISYGSNTSTHDVQSFPTNVRFGSI